MHRTDSIIFTEETAASKGDEWLLRRDLDRRPAMAGPFDEAYPERSRTG